ncbi:hypothetical protein JOM56_001047 [Amanita muscaria]
MAFLVTLPWTCLCGVASALARTIKVLIAQDRIVDLEKGADNSAHRDITQSGPLAAVFSAELLIAMRRTISTISRSIYRLKRRKTSDVDVEEGHPSTCATALKPQSIPQSTPKREVPTMINEEENASDSSSNDDNVSSSQSLSFSSILDLMPIPVTTPEERALAASILAARAASPSPPNSPSLISPCTDSSHDSSFAPDLDVSTVFNTPLTVDEPMMSSPIQAMRSTPFLEQQSVLYPQGHGLPAIGESEEYNTSVSQEVHDPWTGETGFKFPRIVKRWKKRNTLQFTPPFPVVEEDEREEAVESRRCQANGQICDSPWDNGINESYGLKGRASWRQAMKLSDSADEQQIWINNGLQVVAN